MSTLTFDTYAFIRKLKESGISEEQARAQVEALSTAFEQFQGESHFTDLATKHDFRELELKIELVRAELKRDLAETKAELIRWIVGAGFLQTALITALLLKLSAGI
jgi:tRNA U38,U39,U40 pseudouridine synthase TruA